MKRDKWEFYFTPDVILEQAKKKNTLHAGRLAWWKEQKMAVMTKIKEEGLEFDESLADKLSNSYRRGTTVNVRADLMTDLQECVDKIREHKGKTEEYEAWIQVLQQPVANMGQLTLNQDDYLYFFGEAGPDDKETDN